MDFHRSNRYFPGNDLKQLYSKSTWGTCRRSQTRHILAEIHNAVRFVIHLHCLDNRSCSSGRWQEGIAFHHRKKSKSTICRRPHIGLHLPASGETRVSPDGEAANGPGYWKTTEQWTTYRESGVGMRPYRYT